MKKARDLLPTNVLELRLVCSYCEVLPVFGSPRAGISGVSGSAGRCRR